MATGQPRELALSAAWNTGSLREVTTTDGRTAKIIHHGTWSHGFGPDFKNAMLDFGDGALITGDIEIHNHASHWHRHGHNLDANYNNVVLHVVSVPDLHETRCINGRIVPMAVLQVADEALFAIDRVLPDIWNELGGTVCAASLSARDPERVRRIIHNLGDKRLRDKAATIEAEIHDFGAEVVLFKRLAGAFGYSANRAPMEHLADLVSRYGLRDREMTLTNLAAILLGMGGFLPLAPADAHAAGILPEDQYRIERAWQNSAAAFAGEFVPATSWQVARVRPANHPAYRIMQLAALMIATNGHPEEILLDSIRNQRSFIDVLRELTARPGHPGFGRDRAIATAASVVLPFALAVAAAHDDTFLEDSAWRMWAKLPMGAWTQPAKRALRQVTGGPTLRGLGERGHQGLLHLDRELCGPRKCGECPIAAAVIQERLR